MRDLWRRDDGIAMPLVMGVISVLTVISIASFALASNALNETRRTQGETVAFQIANAGIDAALEKVYRRGYQPAHFPMSGEISGGAFDVTIRQLANSEYELVSVGTDATRFSETVVVRFFYINLWEMIFAAGNQESLTAGGGGINGNSNVTGPFYVRGTIDMGGASYVHKGPLFVDGDIFRRGNAELGQSTMPIQLYVSGAYPPPGNNVFYQSVSQSVPEIELPRLGEDELRAAAEKAQAESIDNGIGTPAWSAGPNQETAPANPSPGDYRAVRPPNSATFTRQYAHTDATLHRFGYKYVGANSMPLAPGQGTSDLVIGPRSFGAWPGNGYTAGSGVNDDFAFDAVNRVLYVEGTVFVDGNLTIDGNMRYQGNGTIVVNGDVFIQGELYPNNTGATEAERRRMGPRHVLGIASPGTVRVDGPSGNVPRPQPTDPPKHALAIFAGSTIEFTTNNYFIGSVVAGQIDMGNNNVHLVTDPRLPTFLPDSLPGRDAPILTKGAWARR
jgi:type II secretory pathway pseudopilin PulG